MIPGLFNGNIQVEDNSTSSSSPPFLTKRLVAKISSAIVLFSLNL